MRKIELIKCPVLNNWKQAGYCTAIISTELLLFQIKERIIGCVDLECIIQDPKDGDLCLDRMKPWETTVEVRSGSDVQIDRLIQL